MRDVAECLPGLGTQKHKLELRLKRGIVANESLVAAKKRKNDEFYTQFQDIEREMNAYLDYDPNVFRDKIILLPCDDPEWSNFTKYFAQNFQKLGLKKLTSTSFAPNSKPAEIPYQPTLFEMESQQFDEIKTQENGKIFTLERDTNGDSVINVEDLEWSYLVGSGDFRSDEIKALRDVADIIITNPPFSLFREFLTWILEANKDLVIIGNMSAISNKEVFPLIQENKIWLGNGFLHGNAFFSSPNTREYASGVFDESTGLVKFRNVVWFSTLDHGRRHQPLTLMTEAENFRFSKDKKVKGVGYQKYDNYDAIEVPSTAAIPSDYNGVMGVPISFLDKYNPDQFEVLGITQRNDDPYKTKQYTKADYSNANDLNARGVIIENGKPKAMYARVLIRKK